MGESVTSGFSIGDSELDRVKIQLKNIKDTFNEEKLRKEEVYGQQNEEIERTTKEIEEAQETEVKQR